MPNNSNNNTNTNIKIFKLARKFWELYYGKKKNLLFLSDQKDLQYETQYLLKLNKVLNQFFSYNNTILSHNLIFPEMFDKKIYKIKKCFINYFQEQSVFQIEELENMLSLKKCSLFKQDLNKLNLNLKFTFLLNFKENIENLKHYNIHAPNYIGLTFHKFSLFEQNLNTLKKNMLKFLQNSSINNWEFEQNKQDNVENWTSQNVKQDSTENVKQDSTENVEEKKKETKVSLLNLIFSKTVSFFEKVKSWFFK
jgi:hypothetical protein